MNNFLDLFTRLEMNAINMFVVPTFISMLLDTCCCSFKCERSHLYLVTVNKTTGKQQ